MLLKVLRARVGIQGVQMMYGNVSSSTMKENLLGQRNIGHGSLFTMKCVFTRMMQGQENYILNQAWENDISRIA
ncbi:MAG: hypothetical protein A3C80_00725 [Candidatus Ryanbacteria bacterium RIFCSPHIGHO2_02_FULL_45_43]|uniref:Uncharacterized protein n=1 Tax=Candidatus Ryanbacteria bacterium RIFCSPHIGHO2_01_45_13 TaxID=1802112 RepID=A0A1G2FYI1_9BACT|nr:MAG: hypothetical protein A2718_02115 [Candidatus Ryanbacteria bacterium RIFCSPHIGHO2_01_FULL_44_130]OGZ42678.1 MAG: hypothetical protein A2W41_02950 [Candidatus Ryanbacteria bacterium RIFCSPHIGHO2_01_45_13]OGZ48833.1 MAG: hypothetical protein A3C80_00725 [Candidatus Ryanbacteria bacterium RIFCSPHIGHO2_02_FULL_45_43]OGZ50865.1 MAG: hypothetical protein A3E55_02745 [Candidatus Ryanbacteria bacterium RIFCSPHIGHO2_12_FULL_44_20]OGZ52076.1 MAG: hypothetical protein A3A17_01330 [Candidatus Ryanba